MAECVWSSTNVPSPDCCHYLICMKFPWKIPIHRVSLHLTWLRDHRLKKKKKNSTSRLFVENNQRQLYNTAVAYSSHSSWSNKNLAKKENMKMKCSEGTLKCFSIFLGSIRLPTCLDLYTCPGNYWKGITFSFLAELEDP